MTKSKKTKWSLNETIVSGDKAYNLGITYISQMDGRLTEEKLNSIKTNVDSLKEFKEKKTQNLVGQKSKTVAKDDYLEQVRTKMSNLRKIVKNEKTSTPELQKAFGIGERLNSSESHVIAAYNLIISTYNTNKTWCNQIGIVDADISELTALLEKYKEKETEQEEAIKLKTTSTFDKNILQRIVEDDATHISDIGVNVFALKDKNIAELFAGIIPSSGNGDKNEENEENNSSLNTETVDEKKQD